MLDYCRMSLIIPEEAAYTKENVQASIINCLLEKCLAQLIWLSKGLSVERTALKEMGIHMDRRVVDQVECLLTTLSEKHPGLQVAIQGHYLYYPERSPQIPWWDDHGGFFEGKIENGKVYIEDTPIV